MSGRRLGVAAALVDEQLVPGDVLVADGRVSAVGLGDGTAGRGLAAPGLVDLQVNGYGGVDLLHADADGWTAAATALARDGVTAFVANLVTAAASTTRAALAHVDALAGSAAAGSARLLGAALEGPFLSPHRAGVHAPEHLRAPSVEALAELVADHRVTGLTLAPDLPGAADVVRWAAGRGLLVSLGHSPATSAQAHAAFDAGARTVTHLFNAMSPVTAREGGLAAAALSRPDVAVQLICDRVHLSDDVVRLALRAATGGWVLVTDAMAAAGQGDGEYAIGGRAVTVRDGVARDPDGVIAGSVTTLAAAVRDAVRCGADELAAITAASTRPARLLGVDLGRLRPGDPADVVVLDDGLQVLRTLRDGEEVG